MEFQTLLVLSGKGGVGKSTCAVHIAECLVASGKRVGLLDLDLCGPSIAQMLGVEDGAIHQSAAGWLPVTTTSGLRVMSIAFLSSDRTAPVVWRGPKKTAVIRQFINDVVWGDIEYLVVDTPPGTSDEHITVVSELSHSDAILITTPQNISLADVRREIDFCRKTKINILGLFENMSGFVCPHCSECTNIFSSGGGDSLCKMTGVNFLGRIPIVASIAESTSKDQKREALKVVQAFVDSLSK